jgi:pimeloyl-ACP methyl ester carboxylesterase
MFGSVQTATRRAGSLNPIMSIETTENAATPSIVLVHGAFADGGSWSRVIPMLEDSGCRVTAIQIPLTSLREDVATARRAIEAQRGPVVLVGHGYGGAVITAAAVDARNVKALVYVAAFAPDAGEHLQALLMAHPSKLSTALASDSAGFLTIDRAKFGEVFAADVSERERRVLAAVQKPIHGDILTHVFGPPAWRHVPSWYLVATEDQAIEPGLQRMFAARMDATSREVKTSHAPFASNPVAVDGIIQAALASIDRAFIASAQTSSRGRLVMPVGHGALLKPTIH